jgi:hypothetical protein
MYIGAGRVEAELYPQLSAGLLCLGEPFCQFCLGENLNRASPQRLYLFRNICRHNPDLENITA